MKKIIVVAVVISLSMILGTSCSNDIDLTSEWKDIPVVYGFISASDDAHYIRVEKAFLDPNTSALDIAQIPDSLYYDNATVQMQKVGSSEPPIIFQRVDGNEEGIFREEGVFTNAPNYLYKYEFPTGQNWDQGATYELQINRGDQLPLVTASTVILNDIDLRAPKDPDNINYTPANWGNPNYAMDISWRTDEIPGLFDVVLMMHINEFDSSNPGVANPITLEWEVAKNIAASNPSNGIVAEKVKIFGTEFFTFIGNALETNVNKSRTFQTFDIIVRSGGKEIKEYIDVGLVNVGITSSQVVPTYSNLSEGFGVFSSTTEHRVNDHLIDGVTMDSLINGSITQDLNFQ